MHVELTVPGCPLSETITSQINGAVSSYPGAQLLPHIEVGSMSRDKLADLVADLKAERKQQHDAPPSLYDLTGLQKDMSRLHGLTAARTLTALQSLYEKRLTTYPRTDSQYITHDDLDTLRGLAEGDRLVTGFIDPSANLHGRDSN